MQHLQCHCFQERLHNESLNTNIYLSLLVTTIKVLTQRFICFFLLLFQKLLKSLCERLVLTSYHSLALNRPFENLQQNRIAQPEEAQNTKRQKDYLPGPQEGQRLGIQFLHRSPCQIQLLSLKRIRWIYLISKNVKNSC